MFLQREKLKEYKPFFEYPRSRIEIKPECKLQRASLYQRDYAKKNPYPSFVLKNDFFTTKHRGSTMELRTTAKVKKKN